MNDDRDGAGDVDQLAVTSEVGDEGGTPGDVESRRKVIGGGSEAGETWRPAEEGGWSDCARRRGHWPPHAVIRYRAVLLDIDGTLVDSNDAHAEAWVVALAEHGRRVDLSRVRPLIGKGGDKLLDEVGGIDADSAPGKAISDRRREIFQRLFLPYLKPTRGARALIQRMHEDGITLVVATSATQSEVADLLRVAAVDDLIHAVSSSDDAEESKPDPDIVQAALKRAHCEPSGAIMIGDTPDDIEAAGRATVPTIALRCGGWWPDDALAGAIAIYDDPADLLQNYEGSPIKAAKSVTGS